MWTIKHSGLQVICAISTHSPMAEKHHKPLPLNHIEQKVQFYQASIKEAHKYR